MAKSLQSFLGQYTQKTVNIMKAIDDESDFIWKMRSDGGVTNAYCIADSGGIATSGIQPNHMFTYHWEVPTGVSQATFHAWGAGGSGAPGYVCTQGLPGGSGSYAYKTVSVTPGDIYTLCYKNVNTRCCTRAFCDDGTTLLTDAGAGTILRGVRGVTSYVVGNGLTNFCAEGGNPGIAKCCGMFGSNSMYYGSNDACRTIRMCHIAGRSTIDSDNDVFAPAKYYGADNGSNGIYSCHQYSCCTATQHDANRCGDKHVIAYPGGLFMNGPGHIEKPSLHGGVTFVKMCNIQPTIHGDHMDQVNSTLPYGGCSAQPQIVGAGGLTPNTCGGTCCCGTIGGPAMIRISYS